jgi:prepilin-type N-terminal cleavage/methylation domain-containing protein
VLARRGFTLVEIMVALVIGSLLVGIVLQFVLGQARFASSQAGREEVQQNLRGALEIVSSELRAAPSRSILLGESQAVEFFAPVRWGVVCATNGSTETTAIFPANVASPLPPTGTAASMVVFTPTDSVRPVAPARATITASVAVDPATLPCSALGAQGPVTAFRLTGTGHPPGSTGFRVAVGDRVRYDIDTSSGETWLRRSNGLVGTRYSMQPLAGPMDPTVVAFRYFAGAPGTAPGSIAPPGSAAPSAQIRMVRFVARTTSRGSAAVMQARQDSVTIQIRN